MKKKLLLFLLNLCILNSISSQCWRTVKAGFQHNLAIAQDSTLWAWGSNESLQLGIAGGNKRIPTQVSEDKDWKSVYPGGSCSLALKTDGTLWSWGGNNKGQLGIGIFSDNVLIPTQVNTDTDWDTIVAGRRHILALKKDGSLWAWGDNFDNGHYWGYLGNGQAINLSSPTQIGTDSDWTYITTFGITSIALKEDGTRWAWGHNAASYGSGNTISYDIPTKIGAGENWETIAIGNTHTLAIKDNGSLWSWGSNSDGKLGTGDTNHSLIPVQIGSDTNWKSCQASVWHSVALKDDGKVYAWGKNDTGYAGLGNNFIMPLTPTLVEADTIWDQISVGTLHSISIKNGIIYSWGNDTYGQLGREEPIGNFPYIIECPDELILSTQDENFSNKLYKIYPNPASQKLFIETTSADKSSKINVFNAFGEKVISQDFNNILNISSIPRGLYIIQILNKNKNLYSYKFMKY